MKKHNRWCLKPSHTVLLYLAGIMTFACRHASAMLVRQSRTGALPRSIAFLAPRRAFHTSSALCVAATKTDPTTEAAAYDELKALSSRLLQYDALYYNHPSSLLGNATGLEPISDEEYDALARHEAELCQAYPDLVAKWQRESGLGVQATRYGGRVGSVQVVVADNTTSSDEPATKRKHLVPMLSLDNALDTDQLLAWLERIRKRLVASNNATQSPCTTVDIITEPKLDGLSLSLRYRKQIISDSVSNSDGVMYELEWASTRGNGRQGQDVTNAILDQDKAMIQGVPVRIKVDNDHMALKVDETGTLEVRGEVVLPQSAFRQSITAAADASSKTTTPAKVFANARNAASGILLRKDSLATSTIDWRARLHFYAYDVVTAKNDLPDLDARAWLSSQGFQVPLPSVMTQLIVSEKPWDETNIPSLLDYHATLQKHREGDLTLLDWGDYDMDGCVHKVEALSLRRILGASNRAPRWAVAHKFAAASGVTELQGVVIQVGRTGALTPVALLEPVELGGVTVQRATLHNFIHLQELFRGQEVHKGCRVLVKRAGDVIPQILTRLPNTEVSGVTREMISLAAPDKCPACGSDTVQEQADSVVGPIVRCGGPPLLCPPRAMGALQHAFGRDALDIKGLSDARIQQLMDADLLRIPADLFDLGTNETKAEEMAALERWGTKSVNRLLEVAKRVADEGVSLSSFIYSLGIRFAGVHSSLLIAKVYGTVEDFLLDLETAGVILTTPRSDDSNATVYETFERLREETETTKGIGPVILASLKEFAKDKALVDAAKSLASKVKVLPNTELVVADEDTHVRPLHGMSVVFTGSIDGLSRKTAQQFAKELGARSTPSTLCKSTGLVVAGARGGKKQKQAEDMGLRVIDADEFVEMVDEFRKLG